VGWTVHIQIVRDRPLSPAERKTLATHVRAFKLSRQSEGYDFSVAPPDGVGGVIAPCTGKLARSADADEDRDAARLYEALTALRALLPDTTLEVADDFHLVGWDGERYTLVQNPDQELTGATRDTSSWLRVPPPRPPRTRPWPRRQRRSRSAGYFQPRSRRRWLRWPSVLAIFGALWSLTIPVQPPLACREIVIRTNRGRRIRRVLRRASSLRIL
jgi:hypothetical protein